MSDTVERVKKVTRDILKVSADRDLSESDTFVNDLGASSLQLVELIAVLEDEFDVEMKEEDTLNIKGIGDTVTYIDSLLAGN